LPAGISIELEKQNLMMFSRSKKNYCLYDDRGELLEMKGNSFLSHLYPIEKEFIHNYPHIFIDEGQLKADKYYHELVDRLIAGCVPISQVSTTGKILGIYKVKMLHLGITEPATVTYYYARHDLHPQHRKYTNLRTYKSLETLSTNYPAIPYFGEYYVHKIECLRSAMLSIPEPSEWWKNKPIKSKK
jgi:DNA polymerase elongation subunit (family B)